MKTRVVIVGGGPGGSTAALYLQQQGIQPVIVEKDEFPRYHIGESMVGTAAVLLEELGLDEEMKRRKFPIKHGVKVYGKNDWFIPVMGRDENGELFDAVTYQVRRSEFDQLLLDTAVARGATLVQGQALDPILDDDGAVRGVTVRLSDGSGTVTIESEMLLDCSGNATFLASKGVTGPKYMGNYDRQIAIFSQIEGGIRDEGGERSDAPDNTLIFYKDKYHWAWWIPLDETVVSVGVVIPAAYFVEKGESKEAFLTRELHDLHPELTRRIPEVQLVEETRAIKNYSYQVRAFTGKGFACIGDAHRFLDPIFSFGLYVSMSEARMIAPLVRRILDGEMDGKENPLAEYERYVEEGIDVLEDALDGFWEHPFAFAMLTHNRHLGEMVDIFAGRIYREDGQPSEAAIAFRKLLKRDRDDDDGLYSVPIGSRFDPARAPIWVDDASDMEEVNRILSQKENA